MGKEQQAAVVVQRWKRQIIHNQGNPWANFDKSKARRQQTYN